MANFKVGVEVRFKSDPSRCAIVTGEPEVFGGATFVKVRELVLGGATTQVPIDELELVLPPASALDRMNAGMFEPVKLFRARLTYEKLASPRNDVLYSLKATRTDFLPHQFKPVLKFLESPANGLLIADEVGLGKTIEAGYILKELRARQRNNFKRALVVCPAGLRSKWVEELNRRFDEPFELADSRALREAASRMEQGHERDDFCLVTSFQTLRSSSLRDTIESLGPITLTIIDEAHHCRNPGTHTHEIAERLREISENVIMLSATPVQLGDDNLHALLKLIAPDLVGDYRSFSVQFDANRHLLQAARQIVSNRDDARACALESIETVARLHGIAISKDALNSMREQIQQADFNSRERQLELRREIRELSPLSTLMSRTRKREVDACRPLRRALHPEVEFSDKERLLYDFFTAESRRRFKSAGKSNRQSSSRFASVIMQQQMASCLPAFLETREVGPDGLVQYDSLRSMDDIDPDHELSDEELDQRAERIREVEEATSAIEFIRRNRVDSKFDCLLRVIGSVNEEKPNGKLVVFSFYKRTLEYLRHRLTNSGIKCELISGDVPTSRNAQGHDERSIRVKRFHDDPTVRVLLSSEVGSEGLDFQRASNVVVHYDLPWNPMKVEQRIGRVDRHGQPDKQVYSVAFAIPGTVEERVRHVLHERIQVFRDSVGDLEEIIAEKLSDIEDIVMSPDLTEDQRDEQLQSISDALISDIQNRRELEDTRSVLMGHDDTFDHELESLERSGRSLQPDEIAEFVEGALEAAQVRVVPIRNPLHRAASVSDIKGLQNFVRNHLPRRLLAKVELLGTQHGSAVEISFSNSAALHYVTAHHPLTAAALDARKQTLGSKNELVLSLRLPASELGGMLPRLGAARRFLFSMSRLNDVGVRYPAYSIATDVVAFDGATVPADLGSELVQAALTKGRDAGVGAPADGVSTELLDRLVQATIAQRGARESELRQRYDRSRQLQLQSEKSRHLTTLKRVEARKNGTGFEHSKPQIRKMIESQITNIKDRLSAIDEEYRLPRYPTVTMERIGVGLIEIVS